MMPGSARIHADGEMAGLIRQFCWDSTSVGAISGWDEPLLFAVNMILESQFPALLLWGPEMAAFYNDAYQPLMVEKHPDALGKPAHECWSEAWHIIGPQLDAVMQQGKKFYYEDVLVPVQRQGSVQDIYWTYSYSPARNLDGTIAGVLVVCHDVTAKLVMERERDAIAKSLKNVLESTTDGVAVTDKNWIYTYVNSRAAEMVQLTPEEIIGKSLWDLFPHTAETQFGREFLAAVESGKPRDFDAYYPEPLNAWIECHCYPSEHGLSVYFRNVTEQKRTEEALRSSESRFRKLFESDLMGVAIPDRFGAFLESNDELLKMTGHTRQDQDAGLVRWDTMTPPEYVNLDIAHIREAAERGSCTPYEKEYIRKDGTRVPILCGYALLEHSNDQYIGFVLDLSPQKQAERELREREERFRILAESVPQLIWMTDAEGENVYCNQRFYEYLDVAEADLLGSGWTQQIHPDDRPGTAAAWNRSVETGDPYMHQYRFRRKDGMYRHFLARGVPLKNAEGKIELWIGSSTDIHDQKLAEDALRRSEKLATAGRLAASIAHEINNPLAGVTNALYLALLDDSLTAVTKDYLQTAEQELKRVAQITTQTLRFHKQSILPVPTELCDIVDSVLGLFQQRLTARNIRVKMECERGSVVTCFGDEMRQVIANLVSNAVDAMPQGGTLRLRVKKTRSLARDRGDGVKIVVADSGYGIPPEVLGHIFEPFVSTKDATGMGLGLWVSEEIVRKHRGTISVRSRTDAQASGSVFAVFIPSTAIAG